MTDQHWNKCGYCGRFISFADFQRGRAKIQVDPPFILEEDETIWYYHTSCKEINERNDNV